MLRERDINGHVCKRKQNRENVCGLNSPIDIHPVCHSERKFTVDQVPKILITIMNMTTTNMAAKSTLYKIKNFEMTHHKTGIISPITPSVHSPSHWRELHNIWSALTVHFGLVDVAVPGHLGHTAHGDPVIAHALPDVFCKA